MAVKKISVSLDSEVFERAKRAADSLGIPLYTWLPQATEEAAGLAEARTALAEYIEVYGEPMRTPWRRPVPASTRPVSDSGRPPMKRPPG